MSALLWFRLRRPEFEILPEAWRLTFTPHPPGGYHNCADEILNCARKRRLRTKVIFINDGPGLLLGSTWDDYAHLERSRPGKILVAALRMVPERITREWLLS